MVMFLRHLRSMCGMRKFAIVSTAAARCWKRSPPCCSSWSRQSSVGMSASSALVDFMERCVMAAVACTSDCSTDGCSKNTDAGRLGFLGSGSGGDGIAAGAIEDGGCDIGDAADEEKIVPPTCKDRKERRIEIKMFPGNGLAATMVWIGTWSGKSRARKYSRSDNFRAHQFPRPTKMDGANTYSFRIVRIGSNPAGCKTGRRRTRADGRCVTAGDGMNNVDGGGRWILDDNESSNIELNVRGCVCRDRIGPSGGCGSLQ